VGLESHVRVSFGQNLIRIGSGSGGPNHTADTADPDRTLLSVHVLQIFAMFILYAEACFV
jgi:hypothetical protein